MPLDYKFDPVTGDLVRDGKGGHVLVATAETDSLLAMFRPLD